MSASQPKPETQPELDATLVASPVRTGTSEMAATGQYEPDKTASPQLDATVIGTQASSTPSATQAASQTAARPVAGAAADPGVTGGEKPADKRVTQLGDFKLVKKLGQGGMGEVYLAHQISLDRQVALKVMNKQFSKQENFVKRFKREAQTMARLNHPNIVQGYAVGEQQGLLFLAMELVKGHEQGRSLQDWMNVQKKLEVGDALHVILIVADALKYAHEMNLIHRDIKPDNLLVTEKGVVKLSDMGLAKATDEDMSMTQSGTGLGTPYYMPPEQASDAKHVDHRSDIYALGCTFYYFLTGELPFKGNSAMELVLAKNKGTFPRARSLNKEIPERLDLIIDKMIAKEPKSRYQTYEELIRDLQSLGRANPVLSFIANTGSAVLTPSVAVLAGSTAVAANASTAARSPTVVPTKSAPAKSASAAVTTSGISEETQWTVLQTQPSGPPKKARFTTAQIRQLLKAGTLDPKLKAAPGNSHEFRAIGTYTQFDQIMKSKVVQTKAAKTTEKFDDLYKQIDRAQRWRPWVKWFKGFFDGVAGLISLVVYLGVLCGLAFAVYYFWPAIMATVTSASTSATSPPAVTSPAP